MFAPATRCSEVLDVSNAPPFSLVRRQPALAVRDDVTRDQSLLSINSRSGDRDPRPTRAFLAWLFRKPTLQTRHTLSHYSTCWTPTPFYHSCAFTFAFTTNSIPRPSTQSPERAARLTDPLRPPAHTAFCDNLVPTREHTSTAKEENEGKPNR